MVDIPALARAIRGTTANGVPFIALPPDEGQTAQALIILWHGADPPRSKEALACAVPLTGLAAWRVYLGLSLCGQRAPEGGPEAVMRRAGEDAITLAFHPIIAGAAAELPDAVADLRAQLAIAPDLSLGIFGFSMGGSAALIAVARGDLPIRAAVTFGATVDLRVLVDYLSAQYGMTYDWTAERTALAAEISALHQGDDIAASGTVVLLGMGADDTYLIHESSEQFAADASSVGGAIETETVLGVAHGFVDEPGVEAVLQGPEAQAVDQMVCRCSASFLHEAYGPLTPGSLPPEGARGEGRKGGDQEPERRGEPCVRPYVHHQPSPPVSPVAPSGGKAGLGGYPWLCGRLRLQRAGAGAAGHRSGRAP